MSKEFVTMQQLGTMVGDLIYKMNEDEFIPDTIIAISKGGIIAGTMLSYHTGANLVISYPGGYFDVSSEIGDKILIVDDIVDTGETVKQVIDELEREWFFDEEALDDVYVASLFVTRGCELVDYYHQEISTHDSVEFEFKKPF